MPSWSTSNTPAKPNRLATGAGLVSWSTSGATERRADDVALIALPAEDAEADEVFVALIRVAEFNVTPRKIGVPARSGLQTHPGVRCHGLPSSASGGVSASTSIQ